MHFILTISILLFLILTAILLHYFSDVLSELQEHFIPIVGVIFVLFLGAAVYLSYAVPSLASAEIPFPSEKQSVFQDTIQGLPLEEE